MSRPDRILLFDIDGTLILTKGAGTRAMNRAFQRLFSLSPPPNALDGLDIGGRSDTWIVETAMRRHGIARTQANLRAFKEAYAEGLPAMLQETNGHVLSGIEPLLEALSPQPLTVGLGTGNFRQTGMTKLNHFGIGHYFVDGGFGEDSAERADILAAGVARLRPLASDTADVVVMGDTVHDITAGHAIGAKVVAVATGSNSYEELTAARADVTLRDCTVLERVIEALLH